MRTRNVLTVQVQREKDVNVFCPRCGLVVPLETKCIPSPTRPEVHYHAACMYAMAAQLQRPIQWA